MLIIEGPDLVGKTTLAHACVRKLNEEGSPHVYEHLTKLADSFDRFWNYLPLIHRYTVRDRFYFSRIAYGRVFKNQEVPSDLERKLLEGEIAKVGGYRVVITADEKWLRSRYRDGEMYALDGVVSVNEEYMNLAESADFWWHIKGDDGWLTADRIVPNYQRRQRELDKLIHRRSNPVLSQDPVHDPFRR